MTEIIIREFLTGAGGTVAGALLLYFALRLFDEPLKAVVSIVAAKEVESFKGQLSEHLESLRNQLQRDRDVESLYRGKRIEFLERQLSQFYWPLHLRLQRDDAVWRRILDKKSADLTLKEVARSIDEHVLLPNHMEIVGIIEKGLHLARSDRELESALLQYIRHIAVYMALRQSGNYSTDPYDLGEPYPSGLSEKIEWRTKQLQAEYDQLIELETTAIPAAG